MNLDGPDPATGFYRTQLLLDQDAEQVGRYDKRAVVPFGEYIPLRALPRLVPAARSRSRATSCRPPSRASSSSTASPLAVLICFETLFGDVARDNVMRG